MQKGTLFSASFLAFVLSYLFDNRHSDRCGLISHCSLTCISWWRVMLNIFSYTCWSFVYLLWKNVYLSHLPILKLGYLGIFLLSCFRSLYILDINPLSDMWFASIFSHSTDCLFILLMVSFAEWRKFCLFLVFVVCYFKGNFS